MKLLDLIHPTFGAISICDAYIGESRKEWALDGYDKDGLTKMDANYHLYADLELDNRGFKDGIIRFEFDNNDDTISRLFLEVVFRDTVSLKKSKYLLLHDYLAQSDLFDDYSHNENDWTFRNGANEVHVEVFERSLTLEVYAPSDSGIEPGPHYERGVLRTVAGLGRGEQDDWEEFMTEANSKPAFDISSFASKTVMLTYGREAEEYPCLWLILTEESFKDNPGVATAEELTVETLKMIMMQAGMEGIDLLPERVLENIVFDPISREPMDLLEVEDGKDAKPMTVLQLERTLNAIKSLDISRQDEM